MQLGGGVHELQHALVSPVQSDGALLCVLEAHVQGEEGVLSVLFLLQKLSHSPTLLILQCRLLR